MFCNIASVSQGRISQSIIWDGITPPPFLQENFYRCVKFGNSTRKYKFFSFRIDVDSKNMHLLNVSLAAVEKRVSKLRAFLHNS